LGGVGAPDFVLTRKAVDVRTGATDPAAFDHCRPLAGLSHVPGEVLAALAAADDHHVVRFRFGHHYLSFIAIGPDRSGALLEPGPPLALFRIFPASALRKPLLRRFYRSPVGRTIISLTSTFSGCSMAKRIARAIASA